jgi:predicted SprT family Zn-dependent metalloprotease
MDLLNESARLRAEQSELILTILELQDNQVLALTKRVNMLEKRMLVEEHTMKYQLAEQYCDCDDGELTVRPGMDPTYQENAYRCAECDRVVLG